jgi:two-component system, OmpR family, alkaline phosphatase synthesis response regulator PhoP
LKLFVANRGKPLSRRKLLEIGWGYSRGTTTRTVDNFIVRFRKYFEADPKNPSISKASDRWDMSLTTTQTRGTILAVSLE